MIKREEGFTLVELMITMVVFVLVIAAASSIFSSLLNSFKQQSKIIESNIEGVVGLDMMRVDIQQAGFGIPWFVDSNGDGVVDSTDSWADLDPKYLEATGGDGSDPTTPSYYNDGNYAAGGNKASMIPPPAALQRAPRAVLAQNDAGPEIGTPPNTWRSDYLVVKSTSLALVAAAQKWTYVTNNNGVFVTADWNDPNRHDPNEALANTDWVITERPVIGAQQNVLVMAAAPTFSTQFGPGGNLVYPPDLDAETHLIYGVSQTAPRAPFNRADFYVATPVGNMPAKCAPNTGILYKAVMNNNVGTATSGGFQILPLLDCVADMQVVFITDPDPNPNAPADQPVLENADFPFTGAPLVSGIVGPGLLAEDIRGQIKGVEIFILAQEGQRDTNFTFNNFTTVANSGFACVGVANCMRVGYRDATGLYGREFDLSLIGPNFANYRWKVYQFAVQPPNLNGQ